MHYVLLCLVAGLSFQEPAARTPIDSIGSGAALRSEQFSSTSIAAGKSKRVTDSEIKKLIIRESIASYPGNCACPYQRASNGSSCGRRSAYNRAGGYAPLCFARDVTKEMVDAYRAEHGL
jgi:hypothetical protein